MAAIKSTPMQKKLSNVLELWKCISEDVLHLDWGRAAQSTAALRTRIVHSSNLSLLQAVVAGGIQWTGTDGPGEYLENHKLPLMGLGESLVRYAIVRGVQRG
jgi:hypothetical protein